MSNTFDPFWDLSLPIKRVSIKQGSFDEGLPGPFWDLSLPTKRVSIKQGSFDEGPPALCCVLNVISISRSLVHTTCTLNNNINITSTTTTSVWGISLNGDQVLFFYPLPFFPEALIRKSWIHCWRSFCYLEINTKVNYLYKEKKFNIWKWQFLMLYHHHHHHHHHQCVCYMLYIFGVL